MFWAKVLMSVQVTLPLAELELELEGGFVGAA